MQDLAWRTLVSSLIVYQMYKLIEEINRNLPRRMKMTDFNDFQNQINELGAVYPPNITAKDVIVPDENMSTIVPCLSRWQIDRRM